MAGRNGEPPAGLECISQKCNQVRVAVFLSNPALPLSDTAVAEHEDVVLTQLSPTRKVSVILGTLLKSEYKNPEWGMTIEYDPSAVVGEEMKLGHVCSVACYTCELQAQLSTFSSKELIAVSVPESSDSPGAANQVAFDSDYFYYYIVGTGWRRVIAMEFS